jgi:RHH-type rel operon transcriptional repressor/antitoxin RelB
VFRQNTHVLVTPLRDYLLVHDSCNNERLIHERIRSPIGIKSILIDKSELTPISLWCCHTFALQSNTNLLLLIGVDGMSTISVRLSDREDMLIRNYVELHDIDLSACIRQAVIEKIEDEYDLTLFNMVWDEEQHQDRISHHQVKKELGL